MIYTHRPATPEDLERLWTYNIESHPGDARWVRWKTEYIGYNERGVARTFAVLADGVPVGEGTLLFDPGCKAVNGRLVLADGKRVANVNALRIQKTHEGKGQISRLVALMEQAAREMGYTRLTIGVDECETRNRAIYEHWGYTRLLFSEMDDGELVLYYEKEL